MILSRAGRGYTKPPSGAGINWSHPLTRGLVLYTPLWEGGGTARELVQGQTPNALVNLGWTASPAGRGLRDPSGSADGGQLWPSTNLITGLTSCTFISWFYRVAAWAGTLETLGFARWETGSNFVINRKEDATTSSCVIGMTTTNASLTITDGMTTNRLYCLAWVMDNLVLSGYINGQKAVATFAADGVGTIVANPDGFAAFGASNSGAGALVNITSAVGLAAGLYRRALSVAEISQLSLEPYTFLLSQSPSVKYFLPTAPAGGWGHLLAGQRDRLVQVH